MNNYDGLYVQSHEKNLLQNHFADKNLNFKIVENGIILPHKDLPDTVGFGGIVDSRGKFVEESFVHTGVEGAYTPSEEIVDSPASVIYFGMLLPIWGHCITDGIKRAWFLKSSVYKKYFKNYPIVYVSMWGGIVQNFARLLEILEISPGILNPIIHPTRFKNIIIPDVSFFSQKGGGAEDTKLFTVEYAETIDELRNFAAKNFSPLAQKKFYFFHGRNQLGEERVAEYFKSKGYEIVRPEKLPFEEQLNILANCENFASSLGSTSHNTIFMKDGAEALYIPRIDGGAKNMYQLALDDLRKINAFYVDSTLSIYIRDYTGPYCYIISRQLKKFFGDDSSAEYDEKDLETFLIYVRFALSQRLSLNEDAVKYYSAVMAGFMSQLKKRADLMAKIGVNIA